MKLRSNIGLKLFALVLFTFEFLAPAIVSGFVPAEVASDQTQIGSSSQLHNPFISLCMEELYENEESKEFDNEAFPLLALSISTLYSRLFDTEITTRTSFSILSHKYNTLPPIYLRHRKLII